MINKPTYVMMKGNGVLHFTHQVLDLSRQNGDIDAGGFYIYEHLAARTEIPFQTLYMSTEVLKRNQKAWQLLTENDRRRLQALKRKVEMRRKRGQGGSDYRQVIDFMLENNCKMEQEALSGVCLKTHPHYQNEVFRKA